MKRNEDIEELDFSEEAMTERAFKKFFSESAGVEPDPDDIDDDDISEADLADDINIDIDETDVTVGEEDDE